MLNLIKEIAAEKGLTFEQAAVAFGMSRYQLRRIALKRSPGSIEFWEKMIVWSDGRITPDSRFMDRIEAVRSERGGVAA